LSYKNNTLIYMHFTYFDFRYNIEYISLKQENGNKKSIQFLGETKLAINNIMGPFFN